MSTSQSVTGIQVENVAFPPTVKPPGSTKTLFLGGAGERGLEIQGKFIKFTAIGVYLEGNAVECLATKWKGKSDEELTESVEFFKDIVTGAFEKFIRVTMILPLTGQQYSEKVAENCVAIWKSLGLYTDEEAKAIEKFVDVFKNENFPLGSSILFTISAEGSLTIGFSKDSSVPEVGTAVIENKLLANSVLESIIGKAGVSPAAKQSLASRLPALFNDSTNQIALMGNESSSSFMSFRPIHMLPSVAAIQVENVTFPSTVKPPGSTKTLFLGGAGERGLEIQGKFIKFTAIGVYLEDNAVECLGVKWKGKSTEELAESIEFFRDIVTGAFEKFIRVTMILPLTGQQYSEKVAENCVAIWKSLGLYTDEEAKAIEKFVEVFKNENFPPGSSILFTISAEGSLTIGFSKDSSVPESGTAVIDNKLLANSVLESIIGKGGVSPAAKQSLASRLPELFNGATVNGKTESE
ncbi:Chalcone isomerase [Corchorus capsularis]|uniref:Chalcone-flavonone isomerase family protein n=1 Tax=Corchorus capsularis TaxID=210143 RepID=A0A1R3J4V2_COCAP|nr:Chalcone isomerase [Corchorus capsularis]